MGRYSDGRPSYRFCHSHFTHLTAWSLITSYCFFCYPAPALWNGIISKPRGYVRHEDHPFVRRAPDKDYFFTDMMSRLFLDLSLGYEPFVDV